jgi:hypothetical protein
MPQVESAAVAQLRVIPKGLQTHEVLLAPGDDPFFSGEANANLAMFDGTALVFRLEFPNLRFDIVHPIETGVGELRGHFRGKAQHVAGIIEMLHSEPGIQGNGFEVIASIGLAKSGVCDLTFPLILGI